MLYNHFLTPGFSFLFCFCFFCIGVSGLGRGEPSYRYHGHRKFGDLEEVGAYVAGE